jgi:hypothetical protein
MKYMGLREAVELVAAGFPTSGDKTEEDNFVRAQGIVEAAVQAHEAQIRWMTNLDDSVSEALRREYQHNFNTLIFLEKDEVPDN